MKTSMTLGKRIAVGFGLIIIIALLLGVMASLTMLGIQDQADAMAKEFMPEVKIANELERSSLLTMYEARGYGFTEEAGYLARSRENLAIVKKAITDAYELDERSVHLVALKGAVEKVQTQVDAYETSLTETESRINAMAEDRKQMDTAAADFVRECGEFLANQKEQYAQEGESRASVQQLRDRARKIADADRIMELGTTIRVSAWKSQSLRDPKIIQDAMPLFDQMYGVIEDLKTRTVQQNNLEQIAQTRAAAEAYRAGMQSLLANWTELQALNTRRLEQGTAVLEEAEKVSVAGLTQTMASADSAAGSLAAATTTTLLGLLGVMVIGIVLAVVITRSITGPINKVIAGLGSGSEQVASAANQVAQSSQQMAEGASEQASSLEEVSSSLEEITSMTRQNADNARQANSLAETARSSAENGNDAMRRMADAINRIKDSADQTARIVKTIDEIAFQTNLLALNAAVEAARAGDAGKGFAVVAEEVRSLAQRSADAAKTTAQLIEESQRNSENGVNVSGEVAKILVAIVDAAGKVNRLVSEVAAASEEQAQGIDQVNTAVAQMDKVTQSNAANAEESSSASEELSAQARELQDMVLTLVGIVGAARGHNGHSLAAPAKRIALGSGTKQTLRHSGMHAAHALHGNGNGTSAPKARAANKVIAPEAIIPLDEEDMKDF